VCLQIDEESPERAPTLERKIIDAELVDRSARVCGQSHDAPENSGSAGLDAHAIRHPHAQRLPPVAKPMTWTIWKSRAVTRAHGATKGVRRSAKILRGQVGASQKNFRTVSRKRTGCPVQGRSASRR